MDYLSILQYTGSWVNPFRKHKVSQVSPNMNSVQYWYNENLSLYLTLSATSRVGL